MKNQTSASSVTCLRHHRVGEELAVGERRCEHDVLGVAEDAHDVALVEIVGRGLVPSVTTVSGVAARTGGGVSDGRGLVDRGVRAVRVAVEGEALGGRGLLGADFDVLLGVADLRTLFDVGRAADLLSGVVEAGGGVACRLFSVGLIPVAAHDAPFADGFRP